jgi:putative nucleotidyltransferase with HDIG domain
MEPQPQPPPLPSSGPWQPVDHGIIRYLPIAVFVTLSIAVVPAVLATALVPLGGLAGALLGVAGAVAISLAVAALESRIWKRLHAARGIVFSDLMLWGFVRRLWAERRLRRIAAAYAQAVGESKAVRVELLEGLSRLLEARNPYTSGHCRRVARHSERIARAMHLSSAEIAEIRTAALVHDVGKVYTPAQILHKPGPLDAGEFAIVKRHSVDGADMLSPVRDRKLVRIVRHHHERLDGSGYPDGLQGEQIPLGARIIAVADTFDALTSNRPYRRGRSHREALAVLQTESGTQLDTGAVEAFASSYSPRRSLAPMALSSALSARLAATLQLIPGGLLGGASIASVLPAVGAAGLLAVGPSARYEKGASGGLQGSSALALQAPFGVELGGAGSYGTAGSSGPAATGIGSPQLLRARDRRRAPSPGRRGSSGTATQPTATGVAGHGPTGTSLLAIGGEGTVGKRPEVPGTPPVTPPPVKPPPVHVPPVQTPPVDVAPVTVGPVTTPAVTVPSVTLPTTTVGSLTVPGVHVEAPKLPSVTVSGLGGLGH